MAYKIIDPPAVAYTQKDTDPWAPKPSNNNSMVEARSVFGKKLSSDPKQQEYFDYENKTEKEKKAYKKDKEAKAKSNAQEKEKEAAAAEVKRMEEERLAKLSLAQISERLYMIEPRSGRSIYVKGDGISGFGESSVEKVLVSYTRTILYKLKYPNGHSGDSIQESFSSKNSPNQEAEVREKVAAKLKDLDDNLTSGNYDREKYNTRDNLRGRPILVIEDAADDRTYKKKKVPLTDPKTGEPVMEKGIQKTTEVDEYVPVLTTKQSNSQKSYISDRGENSSIRISGLSQNEAAKKVGNSKAYELLTKSDQREWSAIYRDIQDELLLSETNKVNRYQKFLLTDVQVSYNEKTQIVSTFGDSEVVYHFGKQPIMVSLSGIVFDSIQHDWFYSFVQMYAKYGRGTALANANQTAIIELPNMTLEGSILSLTHTQNSQRDTDVSFSIQFYAKKITPKSSENFAANFASGRKYVFTPPPKNTPAKADTGFMATIASWGSAISGGITDLTNGLNAITDQARKGGTLLANSSTKIEAFGNRLKAVMAAASRLYNSIENPRSLIASMNRSSGNIARLPQTLADSFKSMKRIGKTNTTFPVSAGAAPTRKFALAAVTAKAATKAAESVSAAAASTAAQNAAIINPTPANIAAANAAKARAAIAANNAAKAAASRLAVQNRADADAAAAAIAKANREAAIAKRRHAIISSGGTYSDSTSLQIRV
jgi:hypothetical protein